MATKQAIAKEKLDNIKAMFKMVNSSLTREEFVDAFKAVIASIKKAEDDLKAKIDSKTQNELKNLQALQKDFMGIIEEAKEEKNNTLTAFRKRTIEAINLLFIKSSVHKRLSAIASSHEITLKQMTQALIDLDARIAIITDGVDGADGKDADEDSMIEKLKEMIPPPVEIPEFKIPDEITDTIKELGDENKEQQKEIDDLKDRPVGHGGGTSAMGVAQTFKYIAHTEEPVGAIDGANKVYTVKVDIWWIAGFTLNGEQIAELPNYTFINKVITFSTAIPASYSGKDWEIKYIG